MSLAYGGYFPTSGGFLVVKSRSYIDGATSDAITTVTETIVPINHGRTSAFVPLNIAADHADWLLTVL